MSCCGEAKCRYNTSLCTKWCRHWQARAVKHVFMAPKCAAVTLTCLFFAKSRSTRAGSSRRSQALVRSRVDAAAGSCGRVAHTAPARSPARLLVIKYSRRPATKQRVLGNDPLLLAPGRRCGPAVRRNGAPALSNWRGCGVGGVVGRRVERTGQPGQRRRSEQLCQ